MSQGSIITSDFLILDHFRRHALRSLHASPATDNAELFTSTTPSDFDLNPEMIEEYFLKTAQRPAAVLVPVVKRDELMLLFTQRTEHLPAHAGQIAFPGGKIDAGETALAAALREAEEEIGLSSSFVEPIGYLDAYRTGTGYRITPVVALVEPGFTLRLNIDEVADAFEVPLRFFMSEENFRKDCRTIAGVERYFYAIPYGERYIWGATAGILMNMLKRFKGL